MSHEERNVVTELLTSLVVILAFVWILWAAQARGAFTGPDAAQVWAILTLKLIAASIGIGIVFAVVMAVVWRVVTGETPQILRDERDRAIAGLGWRFTAIGMATGFVLGIAALGFGWSIITTLNLMLAGCAVGDFLGNLAKFHAYRRGF